MRRDVEIKIQNWGNSAAIRLNKGILSQLDVEIGVSLNMEVKEGALILTPSEPTYTLEQLLAASTKESLQIDDEDREWLNDSPVGHEFT